MSPNAVPAEPTLTNDAGRVTATRPEAIAAQAHETSLQASLASLPVWISIGLFCVYSGLVLTLGLIAIGGIGFAFASIFPAMVSGTRQRVGAEHLGNAMDVQIAGIGGASLPGQELSCLFAAWLDSALDYGLRRCVSDDQTFSGHHSPSSCSSLFRSLTSGRECRNAAWILSE